MKMYFSLILVLFLSACGSTVRNSGGPAAIDTNTDPAYIYSYSRTKFVPPSGKVLLIVGQEKRDIQNYMRKAMVVPGGFASYWGIDGMDSITNDTVDTTYGIQNIDYLVKSYSNTAMQSAMWIVGMDRLCERTTNGEFNANIDLYIHWVKSVKVPVYLRIGYEFDGWHNALEPGLYVAVYRYIVDRMRKAGVNNVAYVWHSYAAPSYKRYPLMSWYPGDDYVDWVGVSLFGHGYGLPNPAIDAVIDQAKVLRKPVMICESSPINGVAEGGYDAWNSWFVPVFSYIHKKNIKAFSYITSSFAGSVWKDSRVQDYQPVFNSWLEETAKDNYLKASGKLFQELGYRP